MEITKVKYGTQYSDGESVYYAGNICGKWGVEKLDKDANQWDIVSLHATEKEAQERALSLLAK